jgi:hypothetical protein
MSISGIASTALSSLLTATQSTQNGQANFQQIQSEFQQLGHDLQAGNLTQAQQDYATLSQNFPNAQSAMTAATTSANSSNPIAQRLRRYRRIGRTGIFPARSRITRRSSRIFSSNSSKGPGKCIITTITAAVAAGSKRAKSRRR